MLIVKDVKKKPYMKLEPDFMGVQKHALSAKP
jgi:hypothetical protein